MSLIEKLFKVKERGSSTKTEFLGAISAYLAVCYLFIVVPGMLADAGCRSETPRSLPFGRQFSVH